MRQVWFRPWGWIYRPVSWPGALIWTMAIVFCWQVISAVDRQSHSASDTLYGIFPFVVPCLMLVNWVASKTCVPAKAPRAARRSSSILEL